MWAFYVFSMLPLIAGTALWYFRSEVVWWEWLASFAIGLVLSITFHYCAVAGMTHDTETWSGRIVFVRYFPTWVEEYQEPHTTTDSKGNTTTYFTTEYRTHWRHWTAYSDINTEREIEHSFYDEACRNFGGEVQSKWCYKSGYYSGDHNVYDCADHTDYSYPITERKSFENRVKAAPTLFSFPQVPANASVLAYPTNDVWLESNRVMGTAHRMIDTLAWDRMNARLGGLCKVNMLIVGFPSGTKLELGQQQEAKWIGGKKNDLVICFGGGDDSHAPEWAYVFGWTERDLCKQNLQSFILSSPITSAIIPGVEAEIKRTYKIKDWSKFDYIALQPPTWSYLLYFVVMIAAQFGFWVWAFNNEYERDSFLRSFARRATRSPSSFSARRA